MLVKPSIEEINTYKEFAYRLSQDLTKSSFPTYLDGIKTKEDFMRIIDRAINSDDTEILFYKEDDVVVGWIQYYWIVDDKYLGFEIFNIERNIANAIDEFLAYIKNIFNDYQIFFRFPFENTDAISHLNDLGYIKSEESDVFTLDMKKYEIKEEDKNIVEVNKDNYNDFKLLHDEHQDMYWNSDRLYSAILGKTENKWHMFLYYEDNKPIGNIYFTYIRNMMEVYGIDIVGDKDIAEPLLIKALNKTKEDGIEYMTIFTGGYESEIARKIGLNYICKNILYINKEF